MSFEWYTDFVNENYKAKKTDVVCLFYFEPDHVSVKEAASPLKALPGHGQLSTGFQNC